MAEVYAVLKVIRGENVQASPNTWVGTGGMYIDYLTKGKTSSSHYTLNGIEAFAGWMLWRLGWKSAIIRLPTFRKQCLNFFGVIIFPVPKSGNGV